MSAIKRIRKRLGLSQAAMAEGIGCTQGNVSFYEKGQTVPPAVAARVIEFAKSKGHVYTYDDIYAEQSDDESEADEPPAQEPAPVVRKTDHAQARQSDASRRNTEQARMLRRALITRDGPSKEKGGRRG